jgi:ribonuclease HII
MSLKAFLYPNVIEAGCDEAGRGCLAGPVFAAAVVLDPSNPIEGLDDSKKITEKTRAKLRVEIEEKALAWAVAMYDNKEIDKVNILKASIYSMQKAVLQLNLKPELLLIDGNRFYPLEGFKHECIIKGDAKFQSIAAASILAKTHRDEWMDLAHEQYPEYAWKQNKGYPTSAHREAIKKIGPSPLHRMSFRLLPEQIQLF